VKKVEVLDKIKRIIAEQLGIDEDEVVPEASFIDDLGADSLDLVELIMAFEEEFDLEIPDEDAEKIKSVQNVLLRDFALESSKGPCLSIIDIIMYQEETYGKETCSCYRNRSHFSGGNGERKILEFPDSGEVRH